ncbi:hypothetical protein ACS72_00310 [Acinetobacter sp. VT 511]|nr:hypothetical protein ACS72_00310 [Acinetobacter sp. VT 511]
MIESSYAIKMVRGTLHCSFYIETLRGLEAMESLGGLLQQLNPAFREQSRRIAAASARIPQNAAWYGSASGCGEV